MTQSDQAKTSADSNTTQVKESDAAPGSSAFVPRRLVAIELEAPLLDRLKAFSWDPRKVADHQRRGGLLDADYVGELNLTGADVPELIEISRKWATDEWFDQFPPPSAEDERPEGDPYKDGAIFAPLHAWFALGQLGSIEGLDGLIDLIPILDEFGDDWYLEEMHHAFSRFGERAVPRLAEIATDPSRDEYTQIEVHEGLAAIAERNPDVRDQVVATLTESLRRFEQNTEWVNGLLVSKLVHLNAVESADVMEDAHAAGRVDVSAYGAWSDVCKQLGIERSDRITPEFEAKENQRFRCFGSLFRGSMEHAQRKEERRLAKKAAAKRKSGRKRRKRRRRRG